MFVIGNLHLLNLTQKENMEEKSQNVKMFNELATHIAETYESKNKDYDGSFKSSVDKYGYIAGIVRMSDKFSRAENLLLKQEKALINDESAVDTLLDLAAYSIMLAMEVINRKEKV